MNAAAPANGAPGAWRRWLPFLLVAAVYAVAVAQNITLPGVYMDAVNPDYLAVRLLSRHTEPIAAFIYCAGAALRLARFNTMLEVADKRWFTGIPSPAAAALVAGLVWIVDDYNVEPESVRWWAWFVTIFAGLTMVSNLKYYSFKSINLRKSVPFVAVTAFVVVLALLAYQPPLVLFGGFVAYAISGYVVSAWRLARRGRAGGAS